MMPRYILIYSLKFPQKNIQREIHGWTKTERRTEKSERGKKENLNGGDIREGRKVGEREGEEEETEVEG